LDAIISESRSRSVFKFGFVSDGTFLASWFIPILHHGDDSLILARKRCGGWDIVVEWVPSPADVDSKRSRLERGLQIDPFSAFSVAASQLAESGILIPNVYDNYCLRFGGFRKLVKSNLKKFSEIN
jgi:hypothetical protein